MSEPIKVGDLVMIVCQCCSDDYLGQIFTVQELAQGSECDDCGAQDDRPSAILELENAEYLAWGLPMSWLKRIPPLSELEGEKRDEKLTEPA